MTGQIADCPQTPAGAQTGPPSDCTLCSGEETPMSYQLFRASGPDTNPQADQLLGTYPSFQAALAGRDGDVLVQLELAGGRRIELTHLIVGAGHLGPRTPHALACSVGQPTDGPVDVAAELADTARWFARRPADR
jgi:hypothetical protein